GKRAEPGTAHSSAAERAHHRHCDRQSDRRQRTVVGDGWSACRLRTGVRGCLHRDGHGDGLRGQADGLHVRGGWLPRGGRGPGRIDLGSLETEGSSLALWKIELYTALGVITDGRGYVEIGEQDLHRTLTRFHRHIEDRVSHHHVVVERASVSVAVDQNGRDGF